MVRRHFKFISQMVHLIRVNDIMAMVIPTVKKAHHEAKESDALYKSYSDVNPDVNYKIENTLYDMVGMTEEEGRASELKKSDDDQ